MMRQRCVEHTGVIVAWLALIMLLPILSGCGGTVGNSPPQSNDTSQLGATATFTIRWPRTRVIPEGTNRIIIYVHHQEARAVFAYVKDRSGSATEERISVPIPYGKGITFSAEARRVPTTKYDKVQRLPLDHPDLRDGELLGSGHDGQPHDVFYKELVTAAIEIQTAGIPDPGTTRVDIRVNQIVADFFPMVLVLELIRDQNGNPITNLNRGNFEVWEDGVPAIITDVRVVAQGATDLSVCLVLDRSGSMSGQPNADLEQAASTFVNLMGPRDYGAVINFSSYGSIELSQDFTQDKAALLAAINGRSAAGATALYSAIWRGLGITSQRQGAKAIIAMTDGGDNNSDKRLSDVIARAQQTGIPVFTVGLAGYDLNEYPLQRLADETGGLYFFAPTSDQLEAIYRRISFQLQGAIQISFISPDPQPRGRTRNVVIRYRYGQFQGETTYQYTY
jgi:VWFA-related protein